MAKTCKCPGCNRPVWGGGYCQYYAHQQMRTDSPYLRRQEKKVNVVKIRYEIPKVSKRQKKLDAIYYARLPSWKQENPECRFPGCGMPTQHCHHSRGRGKYYLVESTWIPLCARHHDWAENNPTLAKQLALSASRLEKLDDE